MASRPRLHAKKIKDAIQSLSEFMAGNIAGETRSHLKTSPVAMEKEAITFIPTQPPQTHSFSFMKTAILSTLEPSKGLHSERSRGASGDREDKRKK